MHQVLGATVPHSMQRARAWGAEVEGSHLGDLQEALRLQGAQLLCLVLRHLLVATLPVICAAGNSLFMFRNFVPHTVNAPLPLSCGLSDVASSKDTAPSKGCQF